MFKLRSFFTLSFLVALAIGAVVPIAHGQTLASTASFSGSVSDSSGARVANANVTLSSPEKGITRTFKTDAEGNFSFSLLPAATYTLTVQATGFKTFKQERITLEVGQSASQSVALTIGSTEQIEVTGGGPSAADRGRQRRRRSFLHASDRVAPQSSQRVQLRDVELVGQ